MRAIEQSNYRPNAAAKALATRRTRTIAAVIPTLEHSIFAVFIKAIEDELALSRYSLVIATHGFDKHAEFDRCNDVVRLGAEAIIVSGAEHDDRLVSSLHASGIPLLFSSVYNPKAPVPTFGYDNQQLGSNAIDYLVSLGHKQIGVVHGPTAHSDRMALRVEGVRAANRRHSNILIDYVEAPISVSGGASALSHWHDEQSIPEACLCLSDIAALGVIFESQRLNLSIPGDLSVMGFENLSWAQHCSPSLTTIALPAATMGQTAARALVEHLDIGQPLKHSYFDAEIVERMSTCERKLSSQ